MKILAIETSCDETACSVVENGTKVLTNTIASQVDIHAKTGGVVPEVAAREHVLKMLPVLDQCLEDCACNWDDIDALAITKGPGLVSSLIIGTETASVISYVKNKPLIPVQHIVGHLYSNWLGIEDEIQFPVLILTVSGGHNELVLMRDHFDFEVLGETRDDASGEAFDKVARMLGLGYPGGPAISKLAESGDKTRFPLPRIMLEKDSLDFSFSGLKTAVLTLIKKNEGNIDEQFKADMSASFQEAVIEVLGDKLFRAFKRYPENDFSISEKNLSKLRADQDFILSSRIKELHLAGGVSANTRLREYIKENLPEGAVFRHPQSIRYCTDNAAMIACAAYFQYQIDPSKYTAKTNVIPSTSFQITGA